MDQPRRQQSEDIDSFMESILRPSSAPTHSTERQPAQPTPSLRQHSVNSQPQPNIKQHTQVHTAQSRTSKSRSNAVQQNLAKTPRQPRINIKRGLKLTGVVAVMAILVITGVSFVPRMLEPKSPFSQDVLGAMSVPLYYPTKLPGSFKMELGSITRPEADVVMYALSDDNDKRINMTLQKRPDGISLDPLFQVLKDVREVQTKFGSVKYGTSEDGIVVANVFADKTWVIINTTSGILDDASLTTLINSLKS